jgi:chemotaxis protein methyltransferase CheR
MYQEHQTASLTVEEFEKLSRFIYNESGIKMPPSKKIMVEARLRKRLKELNLATYSDYCDFLFSNKGLEEEVTHMVDVITTNKTDFFREPKHFSYLTETALPELINNNQIGITRPLKVWSAGCSSGEEPYTLSIIINEFSQRIQRYSYRIFATDISTKVLNKASLGIYEEEKIEPFTKSIIQKYFLKSKDRQKKLVRIIPAIRGSVKFQRLNFMSENFEIHEKYDIIFCRNVLIYFDKATQEKLIEKLLKYLYAGGYLFLGHSETIFNNDFPIVQLAASTYKKTQ